ncbi:MAG: lipase class 2 [Thermoleophilia bacterium]|nr:lipase class 2 [Thermoleophilia bacterium]
MRIPDIVGDIINAGVRVAARVTNVGADAELGTPLPAPAQPRDPVVLLNGIGCHDEMWDAFVRSLERDGFEPHVVGLPNRGEGDIRDTARSVADAIEAVRRTSASGRVDIVGFSEGGLAARQYIRFLGGADAVDSLVTVGSPHHGVFSSTVGSLYDRLGAQRLLPTALRQMVQGSDFLTALNAGDETFGDVRYTSIRATGFDGVVLPGGSPVLEGATNIQLPPEQGLPCGPYHLQLTQTSDAAYDAVRGALLA